MYFLLFLSFRRVWYFLGASIYCVQDYIKLLLKNVNSVNKCLHRILDEFLMPRDNSLPSWKVIICNITGQVDNSKMSPILRRFDILQASLIHFSLMLHFYTPWKRQENGALG